MKAMPTVCAPLETVYPVGGVIDSTIHVEFISTIANSDSSIWPLPINRFDCDDDQTYPFPTSPPVLHHSICLLYSG